MTADLHGDLAQALHGRVPAVRHTGSRNRPSDATVPVPRGSVEILGRAGGHARSGVLLTQASTGVAGVLRGRVRKARVLLSLPTAVYLLVPTAAGPDVVAVLTSDAARSPLGCVLFRPADADGRPLVSVPRGASAEVGGGRVTVGDLTISAAAWWDPRPKLPHPCPTLLPEGVRQLRAAVFGEGVRQSSFVLPGLRGGPSGPLAALRGAVRRADLDVALRTATKLIGVGAGLTPSGDNVLAGTAAGLVLLGHPAGARFGATVTSLAAGHTTELSRALLRHAAAGRVSGEFAAVLSGLVGKGPTTPAINALMATGPTSGRALALGLYTAIGLVERTMHRGDPPS
jgi:hypothetical protein